MSFIEVMEVVTLVTGLIYLFLEIVQSPWMWVVGIATGVPAVVAFAMQSTWASMSLNVYYVLISVLGLINWRRAKQRVSESNYALCHLRKSVLLWSALAVLVGTPLLVLVLNYFGGQETILDALVLVLSAVATWWLAKLYLAQWLLWLVADSISTALCLSLGMYWLSALYATYAAWTLYGWYLWKKKGVYIDD